MGKVRIAIFCAVFCLFFLNLAFSETILLKSGQKVEGKILEKTDKYVKLDYFGVGLVYYNDEVDSITQDSLGSESLATPQLESLYQAYTSSLKIPQKTVVDKTEVVPVNAQLPEVNQAASGVAQNADVSQLPPEYQKIMQDALKGVQGAHATEGKNPVMPTGVELPPEYQKMMQDILKGVQGAQAAAGNKPATPLAGADPSQLPPEYQKIIKSTISKIQAAKSELPSEEK